MEFMEFAKDFVNFDENLEIKNFHVKFHKFWGYEKYF